MPESDVTNDELLSYLDEMLHVERAAAIEQQLRESESLRQRAADLIRRRDQGGHSVGEVWRRHQLSCPTRSELGSYLLGALGDDELTYIEFHIRTIGCRVCAANLEDLRHRQQATPPDTGRRRRYFESSAGVLRQQHKSR